MSTLNIGLKEKFDNSYFKIRLLSLIWGSDMDPLFFLNLTKPLPNDKILSLTKLKAFADDKFSVAKKMIPVFDTAENIVGKGENAGCQKAFLESLKVGIVW